MKIGPIAVAVTDAEATWTGGLAIDADGSPHAYAPAGIVALDYLANAGRPGNWWGLACDHDGRPYVQRASDPAPGYYVSTTALVDRSRPLWDPRRYVDSEAVPYLSVPPELVRFGAAMGSLAIVTYSGRSSPAIVADIGPAGKLGEGSIALAKALGIPSDPKRGGCADRAVTFRVFLHSAFAPAWPRAGWELAATSRATAPGQPA
jgi:hypothetical protein